MEKINIREIFKEKNPKVAKLIPGFIYRYIEHVVHQKEINDALPILGDKMGLDFVNAIIDHFKVQIVVKGIENIPANGRFIFVANHPLGGFDGLVFAKVVGEKHPSLQFLVNDILMNLKNLEPIFAPVNKHGKQSVEYVKRIEEIYKSDLQVLNFPAGMCSRKINGKITDLEWMKSFITKAVQHKRDVIPVFIEGKNSKFFYNLSSIRTKLGIKANLEMFYLPDEMFRQKGKTITLTFGKPVSYTVFDKSLSPYEWAQKVKSHVYNLKTDNSRAFC
ncbi:MAG: glycerol acyltransferase [Bacteroidetes bacterium GWC2_33_15]|nr:MAG: glycerol acyltransferase [Bacteroidetes bacterium GWA2_33_15]OFX51238.1 MAG: glycerol acyltransferase [Bacteroidetes bacterium GWC2_33_15]OFX66348.1 MAG: glycerol acyltransferase [Bacteroidetes bacterium GWB2_32_14]OFX70641.1 MAG: glycerol acyltransferase [Bacteroidetes bacterium GWD2_33_33]HAN18771.1 glycerol acyltransferase [Bacteroidales bacterium]